MGFSKALFGSCAGPVQSSFVKPRVSPEPCCPPTCRCLLRLYQVFWLILHVCKHCKIRFSLIVAGYVFCKSEAMRREIREKYWLRERKAGRLGKKQRSGSYIKEQNKDREKLLINNIIYMKYKRSSQPGPVLGDTPDLIQMLWYSKRFFCCNAKYKFVWYFLCVEGFQASLNKTQQLSARKISGIWIPNRIHCNKAKVLQVWSLGWAGWVPASSERKVNFLPKRVRMCELLAR